MQYADLERRRGCVVIPPRPLDRSTDGSAQLKYIKSSDRRNEGSLVCYMTAYKYPIALCIVSKENPSSQQPLQIYHIQTHETSFTPFRILDNMKLTTLLSFSPFWLSALCTSGRVVQRSLTVPSHRSNRWLLASTSRQQSVQSREA